MIELVMAVCSINSPYNCKDVSLQFAEVTQRQCLMFGQIEMAKWAGEHPGWHITKYTCRPAGEVAKL